ncbi:hypothetical protein [Rhizobium halophytocola]|uniref:Uncharacterized protein n=1 Tax=Rhizobium halophytocola TaxID=735519 RepID=A0ABS4DSJ5_9HYPH|nr:hypothetical protein [Rhizobium halophytocola]MBP1848669.1 hypothetical protein [Rhizobium halophytocola]
MSPATENLALEHWFAIRGLLDRQPEELLEIKGHHGILGHQYAIISKRLDRMDERVLRIEKWLGLVEA